MPLTGVIHRDRNGTFWFDDRPVRGPDDVPRRRAWKNTLWYATPGIPAAEWAKIMGPRDHAFGPKPGHVAGLVFRTRQRGKYRVLTSTTWGVNKANPNTCYDNIRRLQVLAAAAGLRVRSTIAGTAVQAYMDRYDGTKGHPSLQQLPCRWRGLAHAALHGGPISVLRGGAPYATQIDVRKAYLAALYQEVPIVGPEGGWYTHGGRKWSQLHKLVGLVDATVRVAQHPDDPSWLPPLPVHFGTGSAYCTGTLRGCWTIAQVRDAELRGEIEVIEVHQFAYAPQTRPLFAEIADFFQELPDTLQKRLYTRFWGKFGSRGGYTAHASEEPREGEVPAGGLWWAYDGIPLDSPKAAPTYRPDLAAFVSAHNHRNVMKTLRQLKPESVIACHVDSIWTTDVVGAHRICSRQSGVGAWRPKRTGPLRFYGIGCYRHNTHLAASGYDERVQGKLTLESMEKWIQHPQTTHRRLLLETREWDGDPALEGGSTSRPLHVAMDTTVSPVEGPSVYDPCWTMNGWRKPVPEDAVEPLSDDPPDAVEASPVA
jgi:hypothetical protein